MKKKLQVKVDVEEQPKFARLLKLDKCLPSVIESTVSYPFSFDAKNKVLSRERLREHATAIAGKFPSYGVQAAFAHFMHSAIPELKICDDSVTKEESNDFGKSLARLYCRSKDPKLTKYFRKLHSINLISNMLVYFTEFIRTYVVSQTKQKYIFKTFDIFDAINSVFTHYSVEYDKYTKFGKLRKCMEIQGVEEVRPLFDMLSQDNADISECVEILTKFITEDSLVNSRGVYECTYFMFTGAVEEQPNPDIPPKYFETFDGVISWRQRLINKRIKAKKERQ